MEVTEELVIKEVIDLDIEMPEDSEEWQRPLYDTGEWLGKRLKDEGATDQECEDATGALGQRICMKGLDKAYEVAADMFNRWIKGDRDIPGAALAEKLIKETGGINEVVDVLLRNQRARG